jgi:CBS domain-containing membrane protein
MMTTDQRTSTRRIFDDSGQSIDQSVRLSAAAATVSSIMTRTVYCVQPDVGVDLLATLFLKHNVSGLPVVNERGRPMGVVSKTDLLRHLDEDRGEVARTHVEEAAVLAELGGGFAGVEIAGTTVRDIMMPIVFAVAQDTSIPKAAALMVNEGIHRVPVVDASGAVCGILSTLDIARWVADEAGYPVR